MLLTLLSPSRIFSRPSWVQFVTSLLFSARSCGALFAWYPTNYEHLHMREQRHEVSIKLLVHVGVIGNELFTDAWGLSADAEENQSHGPVHAARHRAA